MGKKENFYGRLVGALKRTKEDFELRNIHDALIVWYAQNRYFIDPEDIKDRIVEDRHAEGIDAVLFDRSNNRFIFVQAKTVESYEQTKKHLGENELKKVTAGFRLLVSEKIEGIITPLLRNLIDEYKEYDNKGYFDTEILILTLKKRPVSFKYLDRLKQDYDKLGYEVIDFDGLFGLYNKYLKTTPQPPDQITFEAKERLLLKPRPHKSVVFTCKGKKLAEIYMDNKDNILEQDVRLSLGTKSKSINKQILETAKSAERSNLFWYFNNGVTIVCKEILESTVGNCVTLRKPQIINGAQTTDALSQAFQEGLLKDDVEVLIKAIESGDKSFIENVTLYTNSQNAIKLRDLCSNDEIQKEIQIIIRDSYGYFYERKRGEVEAREAINGKGGKKTRKFSKAKIISNENAAQAFLSFYLDKPAEAKITRWRIFMKETGGYYEDIFNPKDDILAEKLFFCWEILKSIQVKKKEYRKVYRNAYKSGPRRMREIYKEEFLLYADFFILNLLKDFIRNDGFDIENKKPDIEALILRFREDDNYLNEKYGIIKGALKAYLSKKQKEPGFYHKKFFDSEKSIALIRADLNKQFGFIKLNTR